jgi:hypothetical protein
MKERIYQRRDKQRCSKCGKNLEPKRIGKQRYCLKCHADYMRDNRKEYWDKILELTAKWQSHYFKDWQLKEKKNTAVKELKYEIACQYREEERNNLKEWAEINEKLTQLIKK